MTWNLEVDIDLAGDPFNLVKALGELFNSDIEDVHFEVTRDNQTEEVLVKENLTWRPETFAKLQIMCNEGLAADTCVHVGLGLFGYGSFDYSPYPEVYLFGSQHSGNSEYRRRSDATIDFGNHKAYKGHNTLPASKRCLNEALVIQALEYICRQAHPKSLYLLNEECVSIPWNYHFIFHDTPKGYATDVAEIVQLTLYGGDERYQDARQRYEPGLLDKPGMMFCKRIPKHVIALQRFMTFHRPRLEARGLPSTLSKEELEEALLEIYSDEFEKEEIINFFFVGEGLGIYSRPLLGRYCEQMYLALIEQFNADSSVGVS